MPRGCIIPTFLTCLVLGCVRAQEPKPIAAGQFDKIHKLIKRQPGEWAWSEINWSISFADAQRRSIAEGKPIFAAMAAQGSIAGCV